jgi:tRNA(Phe) wybutosine-synthesizing methylase Tyw3
MDTVRSAAPKIIIKIAAGQVIPKPVKKLEKLFIAPKVRQVLYETSQRVFARCACAQRTGFLIKFFNQESVSDA